MTPYDLLNTLDDIVIQAGSFKTIYFPCYDANNEELILADLTAFGATLSLYGDDTTLHTIIGTIKSGTMNVMQLDITSAMTENLSSCILLYRPFLKNGEITMRFQGRLYVGSTSAPVIPS